MGNVSYSVVLDWDDSEKVFIASVPALSISTYGETREEAIEMAREAIVVTIDGLRVLGQPVPLSFGEC
jgi:predicted RNase H-like HicB family nuclease